MFKGTGTALATPFNEDFTVDYKSLKNICRNQIENNVDAVIVLGTTGESPVIDNDERRKIISVVKEEVNGKAEIILGTGTNDTQHVVALNKISEELKVDGLLIVTPYYNKGTQESLLNHYKYVSERTSLPIMLYNVPGRTGVNLLPETAVKIHDECSNVVAIKEASGNISQIAHLISIKPDTFDVYSGNDDQTLPIMALGGKGIVSVFSNAYPKEMKKLTDSILNGNFTNAQILNNKYLSMMQNLFIETSPMPLKYVMSKLNMCKNVLRLPLCPVSAKSVKILDVQIKRMSQLE